MRLWRQLLCLLTRHRWTGDPYNKVCVRCWKERKVWRVPGEPPG